VIDPYKRFHFRGRQTLGSLEELLQKPMIVFLICAGPESCAEAELRVFYALHHRYIRRLPDLEYIAPVRRSVGHKSFEYGTWGARSAASSSLNRAKSWP